MRNTSCQKGFLLLEATISILIVGLFGFAVSTWYADLVRAETEIIYKIKALMLAQSLVEEYKAFGHVPILPKRHGFIAHWDIKPDVSAAFTVVTVTVERTGRNKRLFSLTTGVAACSPIFFENGY